MILGHTYKKKVEPRYALYSIWVPYVCRYIPVITIYIFIFFHRVSLALLAQWIAHPPPIPIKKNCCFFDKDPVEGSRFDPQGCSLVARGRAFFFLIE